MGICACGHSETFSNRQNFDLDQVTSEGRITGVVRFNIYICLLCAISKAFEVNIDVRPSPMVA
jgi:hypothetical protein